MRSKIARVFEPSFIEHGELKLPPRSIRLGSMPKRSDEQYVKYAAGSVRLLEEHAGATAEARIIDIGCGPGRLFIGMQFRWGEVKRYSGLDVDPTGIRWANEYLAEKGRVSFDHMDVANERYHPKGQKIDHAFRFPAKDHAWDLAVLFSVFSHMGIADIVCYLSDLSRIIAEGGKIFCTLFVEDDVPDEEENPKGYLAEWSGPLHCVRLNRSLFERKVQANGWRVAGFNHRAMASGQSIYVLDKA